MLCGSENAKIKKLGLDRLSTFGLLKHLLQTEVVTLIEALISIGCLQQEEIEQFRPVVKLTEFGDEVMKAKNPLQKPLPIPISLFNKIHGEKTGTVPNFVSTKMGLSPLPPSPIMHAAPVIPRENDTELLDALKRWRFETAHESGVPAFWIFYNSTLNELVSQRPQTKTELLEIKGIGPAKLERFGQSLLEIIAEYTS
jgi:superfamily II DNA helicase RecQ